VGDSGADARTHPTPTADMNVPKNAKVNIDPKFRKKFSWTGGRVKTDGSRGSDRETHLLQLITRVENDWRKEQIKEECMFERLGLEDVSRNK